MLIDKNFLKQFSLYKEIAICYNLDLLNNIIRGLKEDIKAIKNVEILYAVKSNSDKEILKTIYENNIGFDIASEEEFNLLKFNTSSISITGPDFNNLFIKKCLDSNI